MDDVTMGTPEPEDQGGEPEPWSGPSQEDWQGVQSTLEGLQPFLEYLNNPPEPQPSNQDVRDLDPFSDNFREALRAEIQEAIAPLSQYTEQAQLSEAEERAMDIIHDITTREGEFLFPEQSNKMARALAEEYLPETQAKYGPGPRAAEEALTRAVASVREYEQSIGKTYFDRQQNQLKNLAGARREPPAAGTQGTMQPSDQQGGNEMDVVRGFFPRGT